MRGVNVDCGVPKGSYVSEMVAVGVRLPHGKVTVSVPPASEPWGGVGVG